MVYHCLTYPNTVVVYIFKLVRRFADTTLILQVKIWFQNKRSKFKKLMKQGGGTIDTSALANGRGLSAGSPSVAPVWNSSASVKTSVGTPSSYIPSYTSWYPSTHQDSMQQPQLMWRQCLADPAPLPSRRTRMRGARDPAARLSGPQPIQYRLRSHTLRSPRSTPHNHSLEAETLRKKRLRRRNKFSSFTFRADFPDSWDKWSCSWYFLFTVCKTLYKAVTSEKKYLIIFQTDIFAWKMEQMRLFGMIYLKATVCLFTAVNC